MIEFTVSDIIPASPDEVYRAWLSSEGHTGMTGGEANTNDKSSGKFDAWDGYISGENLALEPGRRIVQSWRTSQFGEAEPDSQIEVTLEAVDGGTRVTLHHTSVPDDGDHYRTGWQEHYFDPMKAYFGAR
ncbi:MAG: SRPBCC domain-containing protein [Chloroflexi bacterium]|nr:SRPBCC domain-containing protein [Chloroflexota bacterium]